MSCSCGYGLAGRTWQSKEPGCGSPACCIASTKASKQTVTSPTAFTHALVCFCHSPPNRDQSEIHHATRHAQGQQGQLSGSTTFRTAGGQLYRNGASLSPVCRPKGLFWGTEPKSCITNMSGGRLRWTTTKCCLTKQAIGHFMGRLGIWGKGADLLAKPAFGHLEGSTNQAEPESTYSMYPLSY